LKTAGLFGEAANTNFIAVGLTRSRLETTVHRTRGQHTNHYTTDEVHFITSFSQQFYGINLFFKKSGLKKKNKIKPGEQCQEKHCTAVLKKGNNQFSDVNSERLLFK
jgi:hypothetical protein